MQLFADKTSVPARAAWQPSAEQIATLRALAAAVPAFYRAIENLYEAFPWARNFYNRGKPPALVAHQNHARVRGILPPVLRPDLLICEDGFALTELDSVPGGIAQTAALELEFFGKTAFPQAFFEALLAGTQNLAGTPTIALAVSEESAMYLPEMEFLAAHAPAGTRVVVCRAESLEIRGNAVFAAGTKIDLIYRFFELFDLPNLRDCQRLPELVERGNVQVLPPMRAFQEEKLSLALLHHPRLREFWQKSVPANVLALLQKIVPETWIFGDESAFPPEISSWDDLPNLSQKLRGKFVLKASGFSPLAWGSRGVTIGADVPAIAWKNAIERAKQSSGIFVLQRYKKPIKIATESITGTPFSRARICPFYFAGTQKSTMTMTMAESLLNQDFKFAGTLATFCPIDKKIIHGMSAATLTCGKF